MKRSNNFFKLEEKDNGIVFWYDVFVQPVRENKVSFKNDEYDIAPDIQGYFTNKKLTTKLLDFNEK